MVFTAVCTPLTGVITQETNRRVGARENMHHRLEVGCRMPTRRPFITGNVNAEAETVLDERQVRKTKSLGSFIHRPALFLTRRPWEQWC